MSNELGDWVSDRDLPELNRIGIELAQSGRPVDGRLVLKAAQQLHEEETPAPDPTPDS